MLPSRFGFIVQTSRLFYYAATALCPRDRRGALTWIKRLWQHDWCIVRSYSLVFVGGDAKRRREACPTPGARIAMRQTATDRAVTKTFGRLDLVPKGRPEHRVVVSPRLARWSRSRTLANYRIFGRSKLIFASPPCGPVRLDLDMILIICAIPRQEAQHRCLRCSRKHFARVRSKHDGLAQIEFVAHR